MKELKNKIVFITGASSGIGRACAEEFAKAGSNLILCARRIERLTELKKLLVKKFKIKILVAQLDVRKLRDVKKVIGSLPAQWKQIDILLNNAGLARGLNKFHEADTTHWEEMIDTNIKGLLYVTRTILPIMVERKSGHVINIGSTAGHEVYLMGNVYCATKFAVKALSQSIRVDVLDKNIKVTSVDPGMVMTEFAKVRFAGDETRANKVYEGVTPLSPQDVAEAVVFSATRPENVNINEIILTPMCQASSAQIFRKTN
jgi:3-hydroxy acid dehydrogenase / malonic semialdehyde reductase